MGSHHYLGFQGDFQASAELSQVPSLATGLWYSLSILAILGMHEMGHYFACQYYGVRASLPYFLPAPALTGTLGAFIRIRSPIRTKPELFDIGIAGPLAGFIVAVPLLFIGLQLSRVVPLPADASNLMSLGEPLLFRGASWLVWGNVPDGYSINMHPMAFAAWFGLLATALNLFPMGQLDGGHIAYAVLGRRSTFLTLGTIAAAIVLTFISISWFVWTVLMVVMIFVFGPRHPRTLDEHEPLDPVRKIFAIIAVVIFVISFTPSPIEPFDLIGGQ